MAESVEYHWRPQVVVVTGPLEPHRWQKASIVGGLALLAATRPFVSSTRFYPTPHQRDGHWRSVRFLPSIYGLPLPPVFFSSPSSFFPQVQNLADLTHLHGGLRDGSPRFVFFLFPYRNNNTKSSSTPQNHTHPHLLAFTGLSMPSTLHLRVRSLLTSIPQRLPSPRFPLSSMHSRGCGSR